MTTISFPIYLDHNATTPIDPSVLDAMLPYLRDHFGNPSSSHVFGTAARKAVEEARAKVAALIGCRPEEIVFTSGGSESNNMAIRGAAALLRSKGRRIVASAVEHPSVLEPCRKLEPEGFHATILPVDRQGRVDPAAAEAAIGPETILVTLMHANNEVGTIQPVAGIAEAGRRHGALIHTDAAQSAGKIPVNVDDLGVDLLTLAGHKLYAPKGIGALYIRGSKVLPNLIHGAAHESGRRAGTENVPGIVALGRACEIAAERLDMTMAHSSRMTERLWDGLSKSIGGLRRNGDPERRLPNTLSVSFRGFDAATIVRQMGDRVAASPGAACHSDGVNVSAVLTAMGVPVEDAMGTVRFSTGRSTTEDEIDAAVGVVAEVVQSMSGRPGVGPGRPGD